MTKWYLVLYILGQCSAINTIQIPYDTKANCEEAAKDWDSDYAKRHICMKSFVDNSDKGYVCQDGQNVCPVVKK